MSIISLIFGTKPSGILYYINHDAKTLLSVASTFHSEVKGNPMLLSYDVDYVAGAKTDEDVSYKEFLAMKYA